MKITILDSILHGPLKPWLQKPGASERFTQVLSKAVATTPVTYCQLQEQLEILLQDYPALLTYIREEELSEPLLSLIEHFYEINIPQHTNSFQQFYYLLCMQEALRYFNALIVKVESLVLQDDKEYHVGKALLAIRVLTIQVNDVLKEFEPDLPENENIRYALTATRFMLIVLFFEIQDFFSLTIEDPIQPKFFFQNYLHQPFVKDLLKRSPIYYENFILKMFEFDTFQNDIAKDFLRTIKESHLSKNERLLSRYENCIYLFENGYSEEVVFSDYHVEACEHIIESKKKDLLIELDKMDTGYKRLNYINELLDELDYVNEDRNSRKSIPSRILRFLLQQKEIYSTQLSVIFKSDISLYQNQSFQLENPSAEKLSNETVNDVVKSQKPNVTEKPKENSQPETVKTKPKTKEIKLFKFGFKGRHRQERVNLLRSCIIQLCDEVNLLNENISTADELCDLLTANQVKPEKQSIRLNCYNPQFYYIIDKLGYYFSNLNPTSIDWSKSFISKEGTLLNRSNIYRSKKEKAQKKKEIDNIINQLQE